MSAKPKPARGAARWIKQVRFDIEFAKRAILIDNQPVEVIQVWCDPMRRDAHRDPALRAWLEAMHARFGLLCIVRWGSDIGVVIGPPAATHDGTWQEAGGPLVGEEAMRAKLADIRAVGILDAMTGRRG